TGPVAAPGGTVAVICVGELITKLTVGTPPKATALAPEKFVPVITTCVPTGPLVGEKLVMVGAAAVVMVKLFALAPVPPGVVTVIGPVVAPPGTIAVIRVASSMVKSVGWRGKPELWLLWSGSVCTTKIASVPLNLTLEVPKKP